MPANKLTFAPTMRFLILAMGCLFVLIGGCTKNQVVPAYLAIDSASFLASGAQGNNIQDIRVVKVLVDSREIGMFDLPAKVPILKEGKLKIQLIPYVLINGSSTQVARYTSLLSADTTLNFTASKTTKFSNPIFKFRSTTKMAWVEDFEDNNSTLIKGNLLSGDTMGIRSTNFSLNGRYGGSTNALFVRMKDVDSIRVFDLKSFDIFTGFPSIEADIFMEMDINSPVPLEIALSRKLPNQIAEYVPYMQINSTDGKWKRFNVNFKYETAGHSTATEYRIIISGGKSASERNLNDVLIDNIRLNYIP